MPTQTDRAIPVDRLRFAHGLHVLASVGPGPVGARPSVFADIIRPADLVSLSIEAIGCELVKNGDGIYLKPLAGEAEARLVVFHGPQHIGEQAIYEGNPATMPVANEYSYGATPVPDAAPGDYDPNGTVVPPVWTSAARASRVVFKVPAGEKIPFSTEGLLAAMRRLTMAVHELALPGEAPTVGRVDTQFHYWLLDIPLTDGLVGRIDGERFSVLAASAAQTRAFGMAPADPLARFTAEARSLRLARQLVRNRIIAEGPVQPIRGAATVPITVNIGGRELSVDPVWRGRYRPPPIFRTPTPTFSHRPIAEQTAIEAPFRLVISPSDEARWAHADVPVGASGETGHVELWHSRLAHSHKNADGSVRVDEKNALNRIVRAIWTRDRDQIAEEDWQNPTSDIPGHSNTDPFRTSLDPADRHMLVRQTSESLLGSDSSLIAPVPVAARSLWLSGLGAWLDLHGAWTTRPYSAAHIRSILAWDHVAPLGRDQDVRVVYPGYLYPFGHQAALVKVTNRKMKTAKVSVAGLYQQKFLVIGEPRRTYPDRRDFPFTEVSIRPLVTPGLDEPSAGVEDSQDSLFWPKRDGQPFNFVVDALDHEGRPVRLHMPLLWVAEHYAGYQNVDSAYASNAWRAADGFGQRVAFAPNKTGGDTTLEAKRLWFMGAAQLGTSVPRMSSAEVLLPAVQKLSPIKDATPIVYHRQYKDHGFAGDANSGEVWGQLILADADREATNDPAPITLPVVAFGAGGAGADRGGGFVAPNVPIRGLSRVTGVVGDAQGMVNQQFEPKAFFSGSAPKLFGLISLDDLAISVDSDLLRIPKMISELVSRIEGLAADIGRASQALVDAIDEAGKMAARAAGNAQLLAQAQEAMNAADAAKGTFDQMSARPRYGHDRFTDRSDKMDMRSHRGLRPEVWIARRQHELGALQKIKERLIRPRSTHAGDDRVQKSDSAAVRYPGQMIEDRERDASFDERLLRAYQHDVDHTYIRIKRGPCGEKILRK